MKYNFIDICLWLLGIVFYLVWFDYETVVTSVTWSWLLKNVDKTEEVVKLIDLISHTTYVVCVNFLQFKIDSERQISVKLLRVIWFPLRVNLLRRRRRRNILIFLFWCLTWDFNSDFTSNKPALYLLDYGDSKVIKHVSIVLIFLDLKYLPEVNWIW